MLPSMRIVEHEIKKVISGYRICLVYNLIQIGAGRKLSNAMFMEQTDDIAKILENEKNKEESPLPLVVLLDHQYTPANFSYESLKLNDIPKTDALLDAANKAGYYARLGLVTHYIERKLGAGL